MLMMMMMILLVVALKWLTDVDFAPDDQRQQRACDDDGDAKEVQVCTFCSVGAPGRVRCHGRGRAKANNVGVASGSSVFRPFCH